MPNRPERELNVGERNAHPKHDAWGLFLCRRELDSPQHKKLCRSVPWYAHPQAMQSVTNDNFGPLIAYLVPGATVLFGISQFEPALKSWFAISPAQAPTIGGFLYLTIASIACGMVVSAVRWAAVDTLHHVTGLPLPPLDFSKLGRNVEAFNLLIEIHYRHYQFNANMLVATAIAFASYRITQPARFGWVDIGFVLLEFIFLAASRNTLRRYYERGTQLLGMQQIQPDSLSERNAFEEIEEC